MNMQKTGMVSRVHKFEKSAAMCYNHYTLCEVGKTGTRNGSRYGFAFDIRQIRRTAPAKPSHSASGCPVLVTTGHLAYFKAFSSYIKPASNPYGLRLSGVFSPKNNCTDFLGGCHA